MVHRGPLLLILVLSGTSLGAGAGPQDEEASPLMKAWQAFSDLEAPRQVAILARIDERLASPHDPWLGHLLDLGRRAHDQLEVEPDPGPVFHDPERWAPGMYQRRLLDPASDRAEELTSRYRPWESAPPMATRIRYDFGRNVGLDQGSDPDPADLLWDRLYGYLPGSGRLLAWLEATWDFAEPLDPLARHFAHAYCDLQGSCHPGITLYDAFASREGMDMPDVDVIAYARLILHDDSYVSPIPATEHRQALYEKIKDGFLELFRHRTWIEAAASVYLNPEVELRPEHEPLRKRLLYAFYLDEGDPARLKARFAAAGERRRFIRAIDELAIDDLAYEAKGRQFAARVNAARWEVAGVAQAVLRQEGLLAGSR